MDRSKLIAVAGELFEQHGLTARGWRLTFRNYAHRLGSCCSRKRIIALNSFYVENNGETPVLDTLLHEIAHALVGPALGHSPVWKAMARKLGCIPRACSKTGLTLRTASIRRPARLAPAYSTSTAARNPSATTARRAARSGAAWSSLAGSSAKCAASESLPGDLRGIAGLRPMVKAEDVFSSQTDFSGENSYGLTISLWHITAANHNLLRPPYEQECRQVEDVEKGDPFQGKAIYTVDPIV